MPTRVPSGYNRYGLMVCKNYLFVDVYAYVVSLPVIRNKSAMANPANRLLKVCRWSFDAINPEVS